MQSDRAIDFQGVTVEGSDGSKILENVTFSIRHGEKILVYGESGSGKSTLIYSILGRNRIKTGTIRIDGTELDSRNAAGIRKKICFIPQEPVTGAQTVKESLLFPFTFRANMDIFPSQDEISEVLESVGLGTGLFDKDSTRLSGGEKQRLALARGLLLKRDIMLVDEPASALDENNERNILGILTGIESTVVVVSHTSAWLSRFSKCIHVAHGRATLTESQDVKESF
ncbi:MAG: ATP-binding cassette domain-containing protein [Chitinispirillaceae bacterium]